jgi:hypothetical protein
MEPNSLRSSIAPTAPTTPLISAKTVKLRRSRCTFSVESSPVLSTTSGITSALTRTVLDAWHARGPVRALQIGRPAGEGVGLSGSAG